MKPDLVTVFRSADPSAEAQAQAVVDLLHGAGVAAHLVGDDAPGVPTGAWEVRVEKQEAAQAEALITSHQQKISHPGDASHALDLVTVFSSDAHNAEMEAIGIQALLAAAGIPAVIVGASVYPNLPFDVRVPRSRLEEARRLIEDSQSAPVSPDADEVAEDDGSEDVE